MIDILVLNYNDAVTTTAFIKSVFDFSCVRKILVVDNHSTDDSLTALKDLENDKVIVVDAGKNGGYGAGNNFGIRYMYENYHSEYILVCNPDVIISEETLSKLSEFLKNNSGYAVSAPMMNIPGKGTCYSAYKKVGILPFIMSVEIFFSKVFSPLYMNVSKKTSSRYIDVFSVAGSLFMIDVEKIIDSGLYDENIFLYFEEFVLGRRCEMMKYKIALLPSLAFIHNHSVSISKSYRSVLKKQFVYLRSYRYILKHYFDSNIFHRTLSYMMSMVSLFEVFVWSNLKKGLNRNAIR